MAVTADDPRKSKVFRRIVSLTGEAIGQFKLIGEGDRLLVGVSGGKDSLMLLHVLAHFQRCAPIRFSVIPICFDPQFPGFNLDVLQAYCQSQNWELRVVSLDMATLLREKGREDHPCVLCSRLRRGHLHGEADRLGCHKIVLGHHLDDLCVSLLISLFRGQGITTMGPNVPADGGSKRIIRPLALTPEALLKEAALLFGLPHCGECIYKEQLERDGDRAWGKRLLLQLEERMPHIRQQMLRSMRNLQTGYMLDPRFLALENVTPAGGLSGELLPADQKTDLT